MQVPITTTRRVRWWNSVRLVRLARLVGVLGMVHLIALGADAADAQTRPSPAKPSPAQTQNDLKANPDALVLVDYNKRIQAYLDLRKPLKDAAPPLKETNDPAKLQAAEEGLATRLRAARRDARVGDIFTLEIRELFRKLLYPETTGAEGRSTKAAIKADAPKAVPFKVNAKYPEGAPLPTVPPNVLATLPQLPEELEYRIVGKHLILRDTQADIIVDFIPHAIR